AGRARGGAPATAALSVEAQKDLAVAGADAGKGGRRSPIPAFLPAKLLEPLEALLHVGDVQDGCQPFGEHASPCVIVEETEGFGGNGSTRRNGETEQLVGTVPKNSFRQARGNARVNANITAS